MKYILLVYCAFLSIVVTNANPPQNILDELLAKHAEAMGGYDNWAQLKTLYISLNTGDGGIMDAYTKKPNKFKLIYAFFRLRMGEGLEW